MARNENGLPGKGGPMLSTAIASNSSVAARCLACGHVVTADESISAGLGRDCRRRIRRLALAMGGAR